MVESTSLLTRRAVKGSEGSNPSVSAIFEKGRGVRHQSCAQLWFLDKRLIPSYFLESFNLAISAWNTLASFVFHSVINASSLVL